MFLSPVVCVFQWFNGLCSSEVYWFVFLSGVMVCVLVEYWFVFLSGVMVCFRSCNGLCSPVV